MTTRKLTFTNDRGCPLTIMLEPWGEDYWMQPGEQFEFVPASPEDDFHFSVVDHADYVAIYVEGRCKDVSVYHGGQKLECGYHRPPDAFKA